MNKKLFASVALNAAFVLAFAFWIHRQGGAAYIAARLDHSPRIGYAEIKREIYASLPVPSSWTVFLGDSILDYGDWRELVAGAINRGIAGDTTADVLARVESVRGAGTVVLCVGINDLQRGMDVAGIMQRHALIVKLLQPARVFIVPVMGVNQEIYRRVIVPQHPSVTVPRIEDVRALNAALRNTAGKMLDPGVTDAGGALLPAYTLDGLHLNGAGIRKLAEAVAKKL